MSDDKSVLGNLPRSRPGTRSDKRPAPAKARPRKPAAARPAAPKPDPAAPVASADSLAEAARVAAKAVGTGVKIGTGLAQEVLRRLPRP